MIVTAQQHIQKEQTRHHPEAQGVFSWLLSAITLATKMVQAKIRQAGLLDVLGSGQRPSGTAFTFRRQFSVSSSGIVRGPFQAAGPRHSRPATVSLNPVQRAGNTRGRFPGKDAP